MKKFISLVAGLTSTFFLITPALALTPLPLPDLKLETGHIEEITTQNYGAASITGYKVTLKISNIGTADSPAVIHLSHRPPLTLINGLLTWPLYTTQMATAGGLKKGETITRKLWFNPSSFKQSYRLTLDLSNIISELNEQNNSVSVTIIPSK